MVSEPKEDGLDAGNIASSAGVWPGQVKLF
jgi:hypothetical protein